MNVLVLLFAAALGSVSSHGADPNPSLKIPISQGTISPDGRYGVTVPTTDELLENENLKNMLVEVATKRPIVAIEGQLGTTSLARNTAGAKWSAESDLLLWIVDGKWFEDEQVLFKLRDGKVSWQLDLRKTVEKAILKRTREASPETYAIKKKENAGWGSAYPEGFSVFIQVGGDRGFQLPLAVHASMTSDPTMSRLSGNTETSWPYNLESELEATVDNAGKFTVTRFKLLQKGSKTPH
ncbi:hypothetical protein [Roseimicrobium sp. ORNL1]|uniref:hypothetical protein n=1 Tax=Roseimicrobium sp. ORNL1 TaxID=2711231 RepID=UPI0013E128A4|nr:hypothetical protein [Roseimicrobium sp. ORNL1]QIF04677.1 hypothetical protein G5S37_25150 [Roseimicrobium sp. ORNL1]